LSDGSGFLEFDASRSEKADELGIERMCIVCFNHLLCEVEESLCRDVASGFVHEAVDLVAGESAKQSVACCSWRTRFDGTSYDSLRLTASRLILFYV